MGYLFYCFSFLSSVGIVTFPEIFWFADADGCHSRSAHFGLAKDFSFKTENHIEKPLWRRFFSNIPVRN